VKDTAVFILAAGQASRFFNVPKQLLRVHGGKTVLKRIEDQVSNWTGRWPVVVTKNRDIIDSKDAYLIYQPRNNATTCNTFLSTALLWQERNIILLGDVWYTDATMRRIIEYHGPCGVFGNTWEIFAWSFDVSVKEKVIAALLKGSLYCPHLDTPAGGGKLRHAYRAYVGLPMDDKEKEGEAPDPIVFQYVTDGTMDFDIPEEYQDFAKREGKNL